MPPLINWKKFHDDFFRGQTALVTGGAGFIGSRLVEALLNCGANVTVLDDMSGGQEENIKYLSSLNGELKIIIGSILDNKSLEEAMDGAGYVFHQAALGSVPMSVENPVSFHRVNIDGTMRVLEAGRAAKVKRIVFAASSAGYGNSAKQPKKETMLPEPLSPYAASKVAGEALMRGWAASYCLDTVSLRYFNVFGPRQNANSAYAAVIAAFAKALLNGKRPKIFGDGTQSRDFIFVDDVVNANLLAAQNEKNLNGEIFNVACGVSISVNQLARQMSVLLGKEDIIPKYLEQRPGDVKHSLADISKIKTVLGYKPMVDFETGLKETMRWYENSRQINH